MSGRDDEHLAVPGGGDDGGRGRTLAECVESAMADYFAHLGGQAPSGLFQMVMNEVEKPLLRSVMAAAGHNQSRAAEMLGINRATLRKKLKQHELLD